MNGAIILIIGLAILVCGYIFYGGWLAKQWGVQDTTKTPLTNWKTAWITVLLRLPF